MIMNNYDDSIHDDSINDNSINDNSINDTFDKNAQESLHFSNPTNAIESEIKKTFFKAMCSLIYHFESFCYNVNEWTIFNKYLLIKNTCDKNKAFYKEFIDTQFLLH